MPILREGELDIISNSVEQTQRLGIRLGSLLQPGDVICLSGDMGAGKTVFSVGVGKGWGAIIPLTSPTYNLVHEHQRSQDDQRLHHLDCYRLNGIEDTDSIGLNDILDKQGITILEWAERIEGALPEECLWIEIKVREPTRRSFSLMGTGDHYQELVEALRRNIYGHPRS